MINIDHPSSVSDVSSVTRTLTPHNGLPLSLLMLRDASAHG